MRLTRRETTRLLVAGAALAALPSRLQAAAPEDWACRLERELQGRLVPGADGSFGVAGFEIGRDGDRVRMAGIVRLDWPPGFRQRAFGAEGDSEASAFAALLDRTVAAYAAAWPGGVV